MPLAPDVITGNLAAILARIALARKAAIHPASSTRLIAVTKTHGGAVIRPVLSAGHRLFGENRVQEALAKWPPLKTEFPDIELHMIGPLQTNKVREAVGLFDAIQSVDRPKLAHMLKAECARTGHNPAVFVQVNVGEESQKAGVSPREAPGLIAEVRALGLNLVGLMCVPPFDEAPAPYFAALEKLAGEAGLSQLSMGMSGDFETAIKFGATHVRIGTAIFGERDQAPV